MADTLILLRCFEKMNNDCLSLLKDMFRFNGTGRKG